MNRVSLIAIAALLITSPAIAASVGESTGVNATLGIAPKTADFVTEAATSDMLEIASSQIALQKGSAEDKAFAQQMITDHTKTSNELKALATQSDVNAPLPAGLDSSSQKSLDSLNADKAEDFSADYESMQLKAHKDAVSLFQRYADGGDNAALKDWAAKTLPALQHHLEMAKMLPKNQ